jgi:Probable zinc-ribbon domain
VSKSGKQRRAEIKHKRLERARRLQETLSRTAHGRHMPADGIEPADRDLLARHNNTYGPLPAFYADRIFVCRDCSEEQVWTAKQQKWWYEIALGPIDSLAVRCLSCRRARRAANDRPGSNLLRERCARLRALAARQPDAAAWQEIEDALADKWWGVRTTAIATLGSWGGTRAVERLKAWASMPIPKRWGGWDYDARRASLKALGECLPASEIDWALEMCLGSDHVWELRHRLTAQPAAFWEAVIATEWRQDQAPRLQRLCWLLRDVRADADQRQRWQARFRGHHDPAVRRAADLAWRAVR